MTSRLVCRRSTNPCARTVFYRLRKVCDGAANRPALCDPAAVLVRLNSKQKIACLQPVWRHTFVGRSCIERDRAGKVRPLQVSLSRFFSRLQGLNGKPVRSRYDLNAGAAPATVSRNKEQRSPLCVEHGKVLFSGHERPTCEPGDRPEVTGGSRWAMPDQVSDRVDPSPVPNLPRRAAPFAFHRAGRACRGEWQWKFLSKSQ